MSEYDTTTIPTVVSEPPKPTITQIISTGQSSLVPEDGQIAALADLKSLFTDVKRNLDVNLEQSAPLERFNDLLHILCAHHLAADTPIQGTASFESQSDSIEEEKKAKEVQPHTEQEKFIYSEMLPGISDCLSKQAKTSNTKFAQLVGDSITALVDLLIIELRLQTKTCCELVSAMRPLFDCSMPFYFHHFQTILKYPSNMGSSNESETTQRYQQLKADISWMTEEDINWRKSIQKGDLVDVVKHDLGFSIESWSRGEIVDIFGTGATNLGDPDGSNVKRFNIKYYKDVSAGQKIFRADSKEISGFCTKVKEDTDSIEEWRSKLQPGDLVDVLDAYAVWNTVTVIKKDSPLNNPLPMVTVGFRMYSADGDKTDEMGTYTGKDRGFDLRLPVYSIRVQKPFSVANNADPEGLIVWRFKPQVKPAANNSTSPGGAGTSTVNIMGSSVETSASTQNTGNSTNKVQDERDMEMITKEDQKIFAVERYTCKSHFFVTIVNKFGEASGYESLLKVITSPKVSLENLFYIVSFIAKSHQMFHKQFVDSYYDRFRDAVEAKLLSATSAQLRSIKLKRIEEIITSVWQNMLLRKLAYFDLQVLKSKLTVKIGILFMKQSFLEKRIDGAKMIDQVCKRAVNEIGNSAGTTTAAKSSSKNLLYELIETLREAQVLRLFFSSEYIHSQLVQRSDGLLRLLFKKQDLTEEELEMIWSNCQRDETTAIDFITVIQSIAFNIEAKDLKFFVSKILNKNPASVKSKEVDLMLSLGRKTSNTDIALKENQAHVVAFFWNYIFDEASIGYLDIGLANNSLDAISELLRLSPVDVILQYFQKIVNNIQTNYRGYFSITIASKFMKSYISRDELKKDQLADRFQADFKLLDLLIGELSSYMSHVKFEVEKLSKQEEEAGKTLDVSKLSERVFLELFPHNIQLSERMDFIKEFAKSGSFQLSHIQVAHMWNNVISTNPITSDHKSLSAWLQTICDDFLLGRDTSSISFDDLVTFFSLTICAESNNFQNLNLEGYYCIQGFFLLINLRAGKLVVQDDDVMKANSNSLKKWETSAVQYRKIDPDLIQVCAKVAPNEMEGIRVLWKIAIDCQEKKVGESVTNMLLQVHTCVDFGLEDKITMFEDQFIESCMRIIQEQQEMIAARSKEQRMLQSELYADVYSGVVTQYKLRKVLPVQEKRIIACLSYLKMLVFNSECDGTHNLIPHAALDRGVLLENITINNAYENMNNNGFRSQLNLSLHSNSTVYELKKLICQQLSFKLKADQTWEQVAVPHPWTIRINKFAGQTTIRDSDNGKTLAELGLKSNEVLSVYKKGNASVSKMPLLDSENKLNERAKFLFTQIFERYAIEDPSDSTQKCLMEKQMISYVQDATGAMSVAPGVAHIMSFDSNQDGKLTLDDFLYFYEQSCTTKLQTVRSNLSKMGFRDDLKAMPEPNSADSVLQPRKTFMEMPRFKIAQNKSHFEQLLKLLDLQTEVHKEAASLVRVISTNWEIFQNILFLGNRTDNREPFVWEMVFNQDIKVTMYSLDIIDSIIKSPVHNSLNLENALRFDWVARFLKQGGFPQLLTQLKRAMALAKESLTTEDYSSESSNITKKFIDQMLRIMKTFIFAAIYADQETNNTQDPLSLKRTTSVVEKEKKKQEAKLKSEQDEAQFQQTEVKSYLNGPSIPYNGPYAHVGAYGSVYGPMPPPAHKKSKAGDSDEANIADEDQAEIQQILRENEEQVQPKKSYSTADSMQIGNGPGEASDAQEFEQSERFKQIVEQIKNSQSSAKLIEEINMNELQEKLLDILAMFLSNKRNQSKEEGNIICSALSLWSAAIIQKNTLIDEFFSWNREAQNLIEDKAEILNATDFLVHGIYSPKSVFVRNQFKESIELICEKVTNNVGCKPLIFMIKVLMKHFPNSQSKIGTSKCSEYFNLFGALIKQYQDFMNAQPNEEANEEISVKDLLQESFNRLRDHESTERDSDSFPDSTLMGLLGLVKELLDCFIKKVGYEEVVNFSKKNHLLHEFYYENLYYMPERTTSAFQNKCKTFKSRTNAYKLLYKLINAFKPKEMVEFLEGYLWPMIKELSRPKQWKHQPSDKQRSAVHKFSGLNNLGNICYMISMLQQFYMVPQFRYSLFKAIDDAPENIKTYKDRNVDDNLLRQFQRLFGQLELSERQAADPFDFCFAYKDLAGEPTNVAIQCDSNEFLTFFFDRMENVLQPTSQKYLLQDIFQGTYVSQMVCQSCGKTKNNLSTGYTLSVEVENQKNLYTSLKKQLKGELIHDYACDGCNRKVEIQKRQYLGEMPNVLIVHLQRIVFDYDTFGNKKVNSKFEFPSTLELSEFSFKESVKEGQVIVGDHSKELQKLMRAQDDEYEYRLVGVNIHRGVADSGHYWSMIHVKRGQDEPDPAKNPAEWQASNQSNWKKFDDESVESYSFSSLATESFGGDSTTFTSKEQDIYNTHGGNWGKSAYMLIYERKVKRPIREVVLENPQPKEEKIVQVDFRSVQPHVPSWIRQMVEKDNIEFVIDRQVFNTQFFYLIKLVLKHISGDLSMTQHSYPLEYTVYFHKMHQLALSIGRKVMFDFLSHYHENNCLSYINDYMSTIFTFSDSWVSFVRKEEEPSLINDWIDHTLLDDECTYFFHMMFNCPDNTARLYCGKVVANALNKGFKILSVCSNNPAEKDHPKVLKLKSSLETFLTLCLEVIHKRDCQKNWPRLEQFYRMLEEICMGGKYQALFLLAKQSAVVDICDLIMQRKSPKAIANKTGEPRVEMGGSANHAYFRPLVNIVCHLVRCMHTSTIAESAKTFKTFQESMDKPHERLEKQVLMTAEDLQYFTHTDFINIIMSCEYEIDNFAEALAHVCYANKKLSKHVCKLILSAIGVSDYNRISQYLRIVESQLSMNELDSRNGESLLQKRLEWVFGFPYLNIGLQQGEKHKIGLDSLNHDIKGEVYTYKSMLTYDPDSNNSLLHLLWRYQSRMENYTLTCLECLADIITNSQAVMDYFSKLPGVTYQYARYTDWIQPFLMSQLNKSDAGGYNQGSYSSYPSVSKDNIVKIMSKLEIYDGYLRKKDRASKPDTNKQEDVQMTNEEDVQPENAPDVDDSIPPPGYTAIATDVRPSVLTSSPQSYIIGQCFDENYLNVLEHDGIMLSISYLKGSYVVSRPTGYTNLAVSQAFLAKGAPKATLRMVNQTSSSNQNKSASAMLQELENQKKGEYGATSSAPLRIKNQDFENSNNFVNPQELKDPPKIIVDGNEEWSQVNKGDDEGYYQDIEEGEPDPQNSSVATTAPQVPEEEVKGNQQIETRELNLDESFENWTGDELRLCNDLVYKLSLTNTTDNPVLFKVSFTKPKNGESVNLDWPINGIKGGLASGENATIALLPKILPEEVPSDKLELEKLKVELSWKADVQKIAQTLDKVKSNSVSQADSGGSVAKHAKDADEAPVYSEWQEVGASEIAGQKNCHMCTMLNPISATQCSVCETPLHD